MLSLIMENCRIEKIYIYIFKHMLYICYTYECDILYEKLYILLNIIYYISYIKFTRNKNCIKSLLSL